MVKDITEIFVHVFNIMTQILPKMNAVRTCLAVFVIFAFIELNEGGRYGGGSRSFGRSSSSRVSSSRSSSSRGTSHVYRPSPTISRVTSRPVYHSPTHRPVYTTARTVYRPTTAHTVYRPTTAGTVYRPTTARPIYRPTTAHRVTSNPIYRPPPTQLRYPTTPRSTIGRVSSNPVYQTRATSSPFRTTPRRYTTPRPAVYSTRPGGWVLPPKPAQQHYPHQSTQYGHTQQSNPYTYTGYHGPSKIKIVNKYKYNYPGYYSLPTQSSYSGYYHAPSYYHYSSHDTGSTALGFFLGYGLGRLTTPTYTHHSFYDGYTPRYDHYTVHHYYHNRESIPARQEIPSNTIVGCVGDSSTVCPSNTVSLCTSSGALMCVVSATATTPCENNIQGKCVKSVIPCINSTAPECKNTNQGNTTVSIPCISTAEIQGEIKYVDNTILGQIPDNATQANTTSTVNGTVATNNTVVYINNPAFENASGNTTQTSNTSVVNGTNVINDTSAITSLEYSTKYPITTTPIPVTVADETARNRRNAANDFCVTVVALPAKKKETEGEKLLADAKDIAGKFLESVWGL